MGRNADGLSSASYARVRVDFELRDGKNKHRRLELNDAQTRAEMVTRCRLLGVRVCGFESFNGSSG